MNKSRFSLFDALERSRFGNLNLRSKLTLGNMFISLIVILGIGLFIYLRTQQSSDLLNTQLESIIRARVENDLLTTGREQAGLLELFFDSMSDNTTMIGSSLSQMLSGNSGLNEGTYWDSRSNLSRLSSGSWDNPNNEAASIFIPAKVELTDPLANKLNTLKYSELFVPAILADNPDIIAVYFGGVSSETIYYPNVDLAAIVPPDFDVTGRPWYVSAMPENNPARSVVWATPYQDAALNGLVITASLPVYDDRNTFHGVAAMDIQLTQITSLISNIHVGESGFAFLMDAENRLIAFPENGYEVFNLTPETAIFSEVMDPSALPDVAPQFFQILYRLKFSEEDVVTINMADREYFVAYKDVGQVGYKLVIIVPSEEMLTEAGLVRGQIAQATRTTITLSILLIAGAFILASLASLAIGNRLTRPLDHLTHIANEITAGNLDIPAEVRNKDELGTLATTFNSMRESLRGFIQSLEERVAERTVELEKLVRHEERRGQQYAAIAKVAQAITTTQNLQELLPQITDVISRQFGFYHVGIFLNDASNQYAVLGAANSEGGKRMLKQGHQLAVGQQGIVGYTTGTGKPHIALDVGEDAVFFNNPFLPDTRSEMALPIAITGVVIGALDVQSKEPNAFSQDDVEVLTTLADQVSIAIQNARLFEQTQKSLAEAEAISRRYFSEAWSQITQAQKFAGFRYTPAGVIPLEEANSNSRIDDAQQDRQTVKVPIAVRGEVVGELSVIVPKNESIRPDQKELIQAVADRVAIFAENARLFDETARRADRERKVSEITNQIRSTTDPKEMIETAIKELRQALNVTKIEIVPQKIKSPDK